MTKRIVVQDQFIDQRHLLFADAAASNPREAPSCLVWTYYYLAQHFDFKRDIEQALNYIDRALEHTPTLIELFVFKAKIFKVRSLLYSGRMHDMIRTEARLFILWLLFLYVCLPNWKYTANGCGVDQISATPNPTPTLAWKNRLRIQLRLQLRLRPTSLSFSHVEGQCFKTVIYSLQCLWCKILLTN